MKSTAMTIPNHKGRAYAVAMDAEALEDLNIHWWYNYNGSTEREGREGCIIVVCTQRNTAR